MLPLKGLPQIDTGFLQIHPQLHMMNSQALKLAVSIKISTDLLAQEFMKSFVDGLSYSWILNWFLLAILLAQLSCLH